MRVKITKPKSWFGPYQLAEKLMFWVPEQKDEYGFPHTADRVHKFGEWLAYGSIRPEPKVGEVYDLVDKKRKPTLLYKFLLWLDNSDKETAHIKIDPWDTWSMYETLGLITLPMLKQLKETKHGAPQVDYEDVPEHMRPTEQEISQFKKDGTTDEQYFARWDWVMDEMIFAFESTVGDNQFWETKYYNDNREGMKLKKLESGDSEVIFSKGELYKDKEGLEAEGARIANGFRLFGKYYMSLWD